MVRANLTLNNSSETSASFWDLSPTGTLHMHERTLSSDPHATNPIQQFDGDGAPLIGGAPLEIRVLKVEAWSDSEEPQRDLPCRPGLRSERQSLAKSGGRRGRSTTKRAPPSGDVSATTVPP